VFIEWKNVFNMHSFDRFVYSKRVGNPSYFFASIVLKTKIGPLTFLLLGKAKQEFDVLTTLLPRLVPLYETVLKKLSQLGAQWIQVDEPVLVKDLEPNVVEAVK
jgi:hypothetical protein